MALGLIAGSERAAVTGHRLPRSLVLFQRVLTSCINMSGGIPIYCRFSLSLVQASSLFLNSSTRHLAEPTQLEIVVLFLGGLCTTKCKVCPAHLTEAQPCLSLRMLAAATRLAQLSWTTAFTFSNGTFNLAVVSSSQSAMLAAVCLSSRAIVVSERDFISQSLPMKGHVTSR